MKIERKNSVSFREKHLELDIKDKRILSVIEKDVRAAYSKIGKITNISKDQVRERIKKLRTAKFIIDFLTIVDYSVLGYNLYRVYIKTNFPFFEDENFYQEVAENSSILSFGTYLGEYNIEAQIIAKRKKEVISVLESLFKSNSKFEKIIISREERNYLAKYSYTKKTRKLKRSIKLDYIDKNILSEISNNARLTFVEISYRLGKDENLIRYRFNKLINSGVILGFRTRISRHRQKKSNHIFVLKLKKPLPDSLKEKVKEIDNVLDLVSSQDGLYCFVDFYTEDTKGLRNTFKTIRRDLKDYIKSIKLSTLIAQNKLITFPKNMKFSGS